MKAETREKLQAMLGNRASADPFELGCYERDVAPVPEYLARPFANTRPELVLRPATTTEVAAIVAVAATERIPLTPRAGASTAFFNAVCAKGGILVDLNGLDRILAIDAAVPKVRVQAGVTWWRLERELNRCGLALRSYPSSARSATVGGWLAMLGYGIGSLAYGPLADQVLAAQVVLPDGQTVECSRGSEPPLDWLTGSEGTLGIVTEVELGVRVRPEREWHGLAAFATAAGAELFIRRVLELPQKPFNLHFSDPACNAVRHRLGLAGETAAHSCTVAFDADGSVAETELAAADFARCLREAGGDDLGGEASAEWEHRFFSFALKREGPSMLGAEMWLPVRRLAAYLADVAQLDRSSRLGLLSYCHVETQQHALLMTAFHTDERDSLGFLQGLAFTKQLQDIGARHGGVPYGVGLWNTPYLGRIHQAAELAELRRRKQRLDPYGIMNPGKLYQAPLLMQPPLFGLGMAALAASRLVYRGRTGGERA